MKRKSVLDVDTSSISEEKKKLRSIPKKKLIRAVILDIEGTTTPISFVKETLFPYAARELESYLDKQWDYAQDDVSALYVLSQKDAESNVEGLVHIPDPSTEEKSKVLSALVKNIQWQMNNDRKSTALKALQGHIWEHGYATGELKGEIYEDVLDTLNRLTLLSIPIYIYSSGSIHAQKLLFGHVYRAGNILHLFSGHFDTNIGLKTKVESYKAIAKQICSTEDDMSTENLLFVTDMFKEAEAANKVGWNVALAVRPGNFPLPEEHLFPEVRTLLELWNVGDIYPITWRLPKDIERVPRVGVATFLFNKENKILFGKRKGSHGAGTYALPGGHLEFGEDWETCARREIKEETGLDIQNIKYATISNSVMYGLHYVTIFMKAQPNPIDAEPKICEPDKCSEWVFTEWKDIPTPLFKGLQELIDSRYNPYPY